VLDVFEELLVNMVVVVVMQVRSGCVHMVVEVGRQFSRNRCEQSGILVC